MEGSWILFLVIINSTAFVQGRFSLFIKRIEQCDPNIEYDQMVSATFKTINGKQYVNGTLVLKQPLDNNVRSNISFAKLVGGHSIYLFSINERRTCNAINKYMGEFAYDLERHAQLIPGLCPIPKGRHRVHDCMLDFDKFTTIRNFPLGHILIRGSIYDRKNNLIGCVVIEVDYTSY